MVAGRKCRPACCLLEDWRPVASIRSNGRVTNLLRLCRYFNGAVPARPGNLDRYPTSKKTRAPGRGTYRPCREASFRAARHNGAPPPPAPQTPVGLPPRQPTLAGKPTSERTFSSCGFSLFNSCACGPIPSCSCPQTTFNAQPNLLSPLQYNKRVSGNSRVRILFCVQ